MPEQVAPCLPVSPLASFLLKGENPPGLVFVTGPSGAGKTRALQELAGIARAAGLLTGGLLAPAVFTAGEKSAIDQVDLASGERRRLAVRRSQPAAAGGPATGGWQFDATVFAWANDILARLSPCDLLIVDELGPLELLERTGLTAALSRFDARRDRLAVAAVRPNLLAAALERWPWGKVFSI